jgi:hypothetical protein
MHMIRKGQIHWLKEGDIAVWRHGIETETAC